MKALIGHTGFVGSNLKDQFDFEEYYNSKNIDTIKNKSFDLIISAATPALRWKANKDPKADWKSIKKLIDNLREVESSHFVLISTIDVYPDKNGVTENTKINPEDLNEAYGKHRFELERFITKRFPSHTILRCPQIYGKGMKKGFIYDLIHNNALDFTHKDSLLQFYNAKHFKKDIETATENDIAILNLAVEPTTAAEVAKAAKNIEFTTVTDRPPLNFDMQTIYANFFGKKGPYLHDKTETLKEIKEYFK